MGYSDGTGGQSRGGLPITDMKHLTISRREITALVATAAVMPMNSRAAEPFTAESISRRIQAALGGEWIAGGLDGFKAGEPATVVKGIVTTAMATIDVLKRAVRSNANLVISYEPVFYGRSDGRANTGPTAARGPGGINPDDPVLQAKKEFIEKNALVVFRLRDHWQARKQGDMVVGLAAALGWADLRVSASDALYEIPPASAQATVDWIRKKLNLSGGLRTVGDRRATVRRVLLFPGAMTPQPMWQRYGEVDMIIAGEVREWENTFYAADMHSAAEKKALVTIGRVASEDPGMRLCAEWLKTVVKEVPTQWIGVGDPYWRPA